MDIVLPSVSIFFILYPIPLHFSTTLFFSREQLFWIFDFFNFFVLFNLVISGGTHTYLYMLLLLIYIFFVCVEYLFYILYIVIFTSTRVTYTCQATRLGHTHVLGWDSQQIDCDRNMDTYKYIHITYYVLPIHIYK